MPFRLLYADSMLFMQSRQPDGFIERYQLPSLQTIGKPAIELGNGPQEALASCQMQIIDSTFYFFDSGGFSVIEYPVKEACHSEIFPKGRKINIESPFSDILALPNGNFVGTIMDINHKRLSFFSADGSFTKTVGEYPSFGTSLTPLEQIEGFITRMTSDSVNQHIWLCYKMTDLIEIYNYEGELVKRLHGPDHFFPIVKERNHKNGVQSVASISGKTKDGYVHPVYANGKVYVLYSGRIFNRNRPMTASLYDTILSFQADGTPDTCYKLPVSIYSFTIDEQSQTIYGLTFDPEFHLVAYSLP